MIIKTRLPAVFGAAALTVWPFVFVRPESAADAALIAHEQVHFKEQRRWLVLPWWAAYLLSRKFRCAAEVRAYRVQIALGLPLDAAAEYLSTMYRLGIDKASATQLLIN